MGDSLDATYSCPFRKICEFGKNYDGNDVIYIGKAENPSEQFTFSVGDEYFEHRCKAFDNSEIKNKSPCSHLFFNVNKYETL